MELEKHHSFGEVTPDTAPTIFQGPTRKHKDLVIKKAWLPDHNRELLPGMQKKDHYERLREPVVV